MESGFIPLMARYFGSYLTREYMGDSYFHPADNALIHKLPIVPMGAIFTPLIVCYQSVTSSLARQSSENLLTKQPAKAR